MSTKKSLFKKATRQQSYLRAAFMGVTNGGKTFSALRLAMILSTIRDSRVAFINSEAGAPQKYEGYAPDGCPFDFDILELEDMSPQSYTSAIYAAVEEGYKVVVIDSLTHAWEGTGGSLDQHARATKGSKSGNSYMAWREITPHHNKLVEAMLRVPADIIGTMRSKMDYVQEKNAEGKTTVRKIGLAPIQRGGFEYEFDYVADMSQDHEITTAKTRCPNMDGATTIKPGELFFRPLVNWLTEGYEVDNSKFAATEEELERFTSKKQAEDRRGMSPAQQAEAAANQPAAASLVEQITTLAKSRFAGPQQFNQWLQQNGGPLKDAGGAIAATQKQCMALFPLLNAMPEVTATSVSLPEQAFGAQAVHAMQNGSANGHANGSSGNTPSPVATLSADRMQWLREAFRIVRGDLSQPECWPDVLAYSATGAVKDIADEHFPAIKALMNQAGRSAGFDLSQLITDDGKLIEQPPAPAASEEENSQVSEPQTAVEVLLETAHHLEVPPAVLANYCKRRDIEGVNQLSAEQASALTLLLPKTIRLQGLVETAKYPREKLVEYLTGHGVESIYDLPPAAMDALISTLETEIGTAFESSVSDAASFQST